MKEDMIHIIRRFKKHDEKALETIMKRYMPLVSAIVYNIAGGRLTAEDIEEVTADVFVTLWRNADKVQEERLKAYICCIAKTKTFDRLDTVKLSLAAEDIEEMEMEDGISLSELVEKNDVRQQLMELIGGMPDTDREILMRYYFYYQKISVIAEKMGLTAEAVKGRLFRARKKLKEQLAERGFSS